MIDFSLLISQIYLLTYLHTLPLHITFIYLTFSSEIIQLNTLLEFLSFVHVTSELSILSNYAEHPKGLVLILGYTHYPLLQF